MKKLQRWALFLSDYNYTLHYRSTGQHGKRRRAVTASGWTRRGVRRRGRRVLQLDLEELQAVPGLSSGCDAGGGGDGEGSGTKVGAGLHAARLASQVAA